MKFKLRTPFGSVVTRVVKKIFVAATLLSCPGVVAADLQAIPAAQHPFVFRIPGEPETLDWNRAHTTVETHLLMNLMEGLVAFDADLKIVPALAERWVIGKDALTYTFTLRKGVLWSDGVPLKAKDFLASWKRLLAPLTAASYAYFLFDVEGAEAFNKGTLKDFSQVGIKALDDYTLQVKLAHPVAHWLSIPTFWVTFPIRQDLVEKYGNYWTLPGRMVTVGPYVLSEQDLESKVVLKPNPNYYGKRGDVDQVVALIVKDDATALNLYETGKLDFLSGLSTLDAKRLKTRADYKAFPYLKTAYLGFATQVYPFSNPKIRRALARAIDRSKFPEILGGGQVLATSFVPPGVMAYDAKMGIKFDPAKAKADWKAAGLETSRPLKIEILIPNWEQAVTVAQFIQGQLKKNLDLSVDVQPFDHKTFRAQLDLGTFALFEGTWAADYPDPDNFLSVFLSNSGNNRSGWKSSQFDQWVLDARKSSDPAKRKSLYADAQSLLIDKEAIVLPLYYEPIVGLLRPRVKGLRLNPLNYLYLKDVRVE